MFGLLPVTPDSRILEEQVFQTIVPQLSLQKKDLKTRSVAMCFSKSKFEMTETDVKTPDRLTTPSVSS